MTDIVEIKVSTPSVTINSTGLQGPPGVEDTIYTSYASLAAASIDSSKTYVYASTGAGVIRWKRDTAGTALTTADGAKWSPDGEVYAEHFGAVSGDQTVDSGAAINAALTYTRRVKLPVIGDYYTRQTIVGDNREIVGARGGLGFVTRIIGLSSYLSAASPIVTLGGSAVFQDINIKYDTLTGNEVKGERIGVALTGSTIHAQRGTRLDNFLIENCGTGIGCENGKIWMPFSITIGTGIIGSHSFAGVDLFISEAYGPTGSVITNLYINGNNTYDAEFGFRMGGGVSFSGWIGQLNVEHNRYRKSPVQFINCAGMQVRSPHIEAVALLTADTDFCYIEGPQPTFGSLTVIHNGSYAANVGLIGFGETQQTSAAGNAQGDSYVFRADRIEVRGLLTLADFPSDLPTDNTWLSRLSGFRWFSRRDTAGIFDVTLDIAQWAYEVYSPRGDNVDEVSRYANPWFYSTRAGLRLGRIGGCGPIGPVKSLLLDPNGLMLRSGVAMTGTTEFVTNGFSQRMQTGTVTLNRGLNGAEYLLTPSSGNTYQDIKFEGLLPPRLIESGSSVYMSVYFEIEAIAVDAALNQVAVYLYNRSGTTRNNNTYNQIAANSALLLSVAAGKKKAILVRALLDLSAWTWGAHPSISLMLQLNDSTIVNTAPIKVSNVALAVGAVNPAYTATMYPHNTVATT